MFNRRQTCSLEKRYIHKEAHLVWLEINVTLARDNSGNPLHFIAAVHGIRQRKEHSHQHCRVCRLLHKLLFGHLMF